MLIKLFRLSAVEALAHPFLSNRPTRIPSARTAKQQKVQQKNGNTFTFPHIKTLDIGSSGGQYSTLTNPPPHFSTLTTNAPKLGKKAQHPHYYSNQLPPIPIDKPDKLPELKLPPVYMSNIHHPVFKSYNPNTIAAPIAHYPARILPLKTDRNIPLRKKEDAPLKKKLSLPKIQGHASMYNKIPKESTQVILFALYFIYN